LTDQSDAMGVEQFDQLGEVCQRASQPIDLVDHDDIDPAVPDVGQHAKSDALRTLNPNQAGRRSDDCGQLVKAC
jgi:hypothetical protein